LDVSNLVCVLQIHILHLCYFGKFFGLNEFYRHVSEINGEEFYELPDVALQILCFLIRQIFSDYE